MNEDIFTSSGFRVFQLRTAQERWSWPNGESNGASGKNSDSNTNRYQVRSDVLAFQGTSLSTSERKRNTPGLRQGRYEVKEGVTRRPNGKPENDEFSGEFGEGNQQNDFGFNQKFGGGGLTNGQFMPNPFNSFYGIGGIAGPFQGGPGIGSGHYPAQPFNVGGVGLGYGSGSNGILVGPGGPTGIIGRPYNRFPYGGGYYPGSGGLPFSGGFGNPYYGNVGAPFNPGFYQQPFSGVRPNFYGPNQFGPQFDQTREASKKLEKKSV
ncbi:heterogeneous nuclear ribonucleoprotein A1-like isoform X2 [Anopheles aquasalis]|uniref:heterogeneous nuclear ribonucleoprotein A1-like isoform X2 n=1 Tax=Anopheles aquasalis TaxID=42839 RepID=UPI00215A5F09|nr:heterogeneous nuclear ribonucleoprotein A1-like isoform X2 [Anopheles aquasalis]